MHILQRTLPALFLAAGVSFSVSAADFRRVESATILYDAPSLRGVKLFVIQRDTPVEVVVNIEGWSKVRDAGGGLAWIEKKYLVDKRSLIVQAERADVRQKADELSPLVFSAEKNVILEYVESAAGGWVQVRHRDGQTGFVRINQVWGS